MEFNDDFHKINISTLVLRNENTFQHLLYVA